VQPRFPKIGKDKKLQEIRKIEKDYIVKNEDLNPLFFNERRIRSFGSRHSILLEMEKEI